MTTPTSLDHLQIIVGSTRAGRAADRVVPWVVERARSDGRFEVEVLDLREWPLPMFAETLATVGDFADPTYSDPVVKRWNDTIRRGDAFLFVPLRSTVLVGGVQQAFDAAGEPDDPMTDAALRVLLDDLAWWSRLLRRGRAEGELPPGRFRLRAAPQPAR